MRLKSLAKYTNASRGATRAHYGRLAMGRRTIMFAVSVCLVLVVALVPQAHAVVIADEDFESYTNASTVIGGTGGTGWAQPWIGNTTTGTPIAISSSGKIVGYGKALELGATADNRAIGVRQFPAQTGDVYIGMILQTTNNWETDFWQTYVNDTYTTTDGTAASFSAGLANVATTDPYFARK